MHTRCCCCQCATLISCVCVPANRADLHISRPIPYMRAATIGAAAAASSSSLLLLLSRSTRRSTFLAGLRAGRAENRVGLSADSQLAAASEKVSLPPLTLVGARARANWRTNSACCYRRTRTPDSGGQEKRLTDDDSSGTLLIRLVAPLTVGSERTERAPMSHRLNSRELRLSPSQSDSQQSSGGGFHSREKK